MSFLRPSSGLSRGLKVILNARRDNLTRYSYPTDFKDFRVLLSTDGDFPLLLKKGFSVSPGYHTLVAITPTVVDSDPSLQEVATQDRHCHFPHENDSMSVFPTYSQSNCFLECSLRKSHERLLEDNLKPCAMWYLPFLYDDNICAENKRNKFKYYFENTNLNMYCSHCKPDCSSVKYSRYVTSEKIRPCDEKNFGVSHFCQYKDFQNAPSPSHWIDQAMDKLGVEKFQNYSYLSARRNYGSPYLWRQTTYNSFTDDIAIVSFFFPSQRNLKILVQASQTWATYFSTVGGTSGLLVGVSIITVFEIVWLQITGFLILYRRVPSGTSQK